jgi:predicted amidophosphoribosyltransferase
MYELDAEQRRENIKGAFRLQRQCHYKSVAFVDDIITSGSTMNELARLFLDTGVERVEFWALARAD